MNIFSLFVTGPLGAILGFIYNFTNSYGLAIIFFTIVIRIVLLPLSIKQQKSMVMQQKVQPLTAELQKKYKNDKEKLNQEMMKLYKEHKFNPAGGCLPLIVQMPIIFGLYRVIYRPLTHILKMDQTAIKELSESLQIAVHNEIAIASEAGLINLNFLGLNLGSSPTISMNPQELYGISLLWLIPILAAGTTYLSSYMTSKMSSSSGQNEKAAQMQSSMMKIFPLMTGVIAFSFPAGLGLYWIVSNMVQVLQQFFLNKYYAPKKKEGKVA